jgi:MSHA biogenesis protein MshI
LFSLKAKRDDKITAGLTLSSEGVALAIMSHTHKHPSLVHAEFYPSTTAEQTAVLARLNKQHQLDKHPCNIVLSPDEYQLLQVESPDVPSQEQSAAIRWKIKDLIDFHIDDAVIDLITVPGEHASADRSVQVVACRQSVIQRYVDLLHSENYALATIDIAELAARNLLRQQTEKNEALALLNLWGDYARISLYLNDDLYLSRSSSIGLNTLAHIFENENIDDTSLVVLDSLALELQRTFDYYESHSRQAPIQQLFIQSNQPFSTKLAELIQQRTGIDTQEININSLMSTDAQNAHPFQSQCLSAIGGALRAEY